MTTLTNILNTVANWKPSNLSDMDLLLVGCAIGCVAAGLTFVKILLSR